MAQNKGASAKPTGLGAPEGAEPPSRLVASPAIPSAEQVAAEVEAGKRERHKAKTLIHKRWAAIHSPEKGWHVKLIDVPFYAEIAARMKARNALLRGDLASFQKYAGDALLARCASAIEAATAGETVKLGSTEGESAVGATSAETPTLSSPRRG